MVEHESVALHRALAEWPRRVTSRLAVVEVLRAVRRRHQEREVVARSVLTHVSLASMTDEVLFAAALLQPPTLRSLDAIHLATALRLGKHLAVFVSYDERQLEAAAALGIPTASPR